MPKTTNGAPNSEGYRNIPTITQNYNDANESHRGGFKYPTTKRAIANYVANGGGGAGVVNATH